MLCARCRRLAVSVLIVCLAFGLLASSSPAAAEPAAAPERAELLPYFAPAAQILDDRLADHAPPKPGEYDYPQFRIMAQLLEAAARLVAERGTEAFPDFQRGSEWFDPAKGRYIAIYDDAGRCLFHADAPYRTGALFQPLAPQQLCTPDDFGKLRWRHQFWRTPDGRLLRQTAAQIAVHGPRNRNFLVRLHAAAPLLPYDRAFAVNLGEEAAQLVCAQGERALERFITPGTPFTALPGVGVVVADEKGTLLTNSLEPDLIGRNFSAVRDAAGEPVARRMMAAAQRGGGWCDAVIRHPVKQIPVRLLAYVQSAVCQNTRYFVVVFVLPERMKQEALNAPLQKLLPPLTPLAAEFAEAYALARSLKNNGLPYQATLAFPPDHARALSTWPAIARLAGARGFDFCYAAVFDQRADAEQFADETDRLWRDELMAQELTTALSDLSLTRLWRETLLDQARLAHELRQLHERVMEQAFRDLKNTQLALCYQYGKLVEALFITTQLTASDQPEKALRKLAGCRQDLQVLYEAAQRAQQENLPLAEEMARKLRPLRELFSKQELNPADLLRLRTECARLRVDMLRDAPPAGAE